MVTPFHIAKPRDKYLVLCCIVCVCWGDDWVYSKRWQRYTSILY